MKLPAPTNPRALAVTATFALMLAFGLALTAPSLHQDGTRPAVALSRCAPAYIAVSRDDVAALQPLIAVYDQSVAAAGSSCVAFQIQARPAGSVADALVAGWKQADGPAPAVWLPGS